MSEAQVKEFFRRLDLRSHFIALFTLPLNEVQGAIEFSIKNIEEKIKEEIERILKEGVKK